VNGVSATLDDRANVVNLVQTRAIDRRKRKTLQSFVKIDFVAASPSESPSSDVIAVVILTICIAIPMLPHFNVANVFAIVGLKIDISRTIVVDEGYDNQFILNIERLPVRR